MKRVTHNSESPPLAYAIGRCSLGSVLVARSEQGLCAILLGDNAESLSEELAERFPGERLVRTDGAFQELVGQVVQLTETPGRPLDLFLDLRGSSFQRRVWQALRDIPAGTTASYGEIATRIGAPRSARAVAQACAANPLAVAIPCHRVVRSDGRISGYRWGTERKRALLEREASQ
jgi:AraC family transcriptional regulator of adaptative response/methylated-DNA-[protein]-cysteine methyltransferase